MRQHSLVAERRAGAVLLSGSVQVGSRTDQIISLAVRYALATMFYCGFAARQGGHLSIGRLSMAINPRGNNRHAGFSVEDAFHLPQPHPELEMADPFRALCQLCGVWLVGEPSLLVGHH